MYSITTVHDGKTQIVVEYTTLTRFKVQDLDKAEDLYERLSHVRVNPEAILGGNY